MNSRKSECGFTLIEMIVVINLSFLVFGAITTFYLLTNKYIVGMTNRIEEKQTTLEFFYRFEETLKKADSYSIVFGDTTTVVMCIRDTIRFGENGITSRRIIHLDNLKNNTIRLCLQNGDSVIAVNGKVNTTDLMINNETIDSDKIRSINLIITRKNTFQHLITKDAYAEKLFQNI